MKYFYFYGARSHVVRNAIKLFLPENYGWKNWLKRQRIRSRLHVKNGKRKTKNKNNTNKLNEKSLKLST